METDRLRVRERSGEMEEMTGDEDRKLPEERWERSDWWDKCDERLHWRLQEEHLQ